MKKAISVLLLAVMLLGLVGCAGEGQQLYEKYAPIIDMLEAKDYQGAIREITAIAIAEQQGNVEKVPTMQVLADSWYADNEKAPAEMIFNADGTCTIGGKAMTWLADESEDPVYLHAQIFENGALQYFLSLSTSDEYAVPVMALWYAEERDGQVYSGDHVGYYYNHPMMPQLLTSWYAISDYERVTDSIYISANEIRISDSEYKWTVTDGEKDDSLTIHLEPRRDAEGEYTLTVSLRDGAPVLHVTDAAAGKTGLYICNYYEYDLSWPEFSYVEAKENLNEYLTDGGFWCDLSGNSYSDNEDNAISYLYDQFVALGDYADAADILANWDSVKFSRAMRYLTCFENRNSFWIGETSYPWNLDTLTFIKGMFEEISGYSEAAAVLENWDAVLFNRAEYYMDLYMTHNGNNFRINETYYSWYETEVVDYIRAMYEDIASYPDAAAVLDNWDAVLYEQAKYYLDAYINGNNLYFSDESFYSYNDNYDDALAYIYPMFEKIAGYSGVADILDRFTILENQYLSYKYTSLDHMGNESESYTYYSPYEYNAQGQLIHYSDSTELNRIYGNWYYNAYYTYDEDGKLTETIIGSPSSVEARITPIYDDKGNMIQEHVVQNSGEYDVFYTYDDQNRLIEIRRPNDTDEPDNYYNFYRYAYDDAGRLIEKAYGYFYNGYKDSETVNRYTYDAAGNMTQETETYTDYSYNGTVYSSRTHVAECICDEQGNVIQKNWTYGNTVYNDGTESRYDYVSRSYSYTFGNIYFFDSTGMETAE